MTSDPNESSYMKAAGQLVKDLNTRLDNAEKEARVRNFWQWVIGVTVILSILGNVLGTVLYFQSKDTIRRQNQNQVSSCQDGNKYRAQQTQIWNFFINVLVTQGVSADTRAEVAATKRYLISIAGGDPVLTMQANQFGSLLDRLAGNTKDPRLPQLVKSVEAYIASVNAPRDCVKIYSTTVHHTEGR